MEWEYTNLPNSYPPPNNKRETIACLRNCAFFNFHVTDKESSLCAHWDEERCMKHSYHTQADEGLRRSGTARRHVLLSVLLPLLLLSSLSLPASSQNLTNSGQARENEVHAFFYLCQGERRGEDRGGNGQSRIPCLTFFFSLSPLLSLPGYDIPSSPTSSGKYHHWEHTILQHWNPTTAAQWPKGVRTPPR